MAWKLKKLMEHQMTIQDELEKIRLKNKDHLLNPHEVVEFAKNPKTQLHEKFEWNDKKAGDAYRLWQARQIIVSFTITIKKTENEISIQRYISEKFNRCYDGGYSLTTTVITDKERYNNFLQEAIEYIKIFRKKYSELIELKNVFDEIDKI